MIIREGIPISIWRSPTKAKGKVYARFEFLDPLTGARVKRSTLEAAKAEARKRARQLLDRGIELKGAAATAYAGAMAALVGTGLTLEQAARMAADHVRAQLLRSGGIVKPLAEVVTEFLAARKTDGAGSEHLRDLKTRLTRLAGELKCSIDQLTPTVLDDWLRGLTVGVRTRDNYRGAALNLVRWAKGRRYIPSDWEPLHAATPTREHQPEITVFTPDEMRWLLAGAGRSILPVLVLGGFAGLRTSECLALHWSGVDWEGGHIIVPARTKTGRRLAPLTANARAWLEPLKGLGPVVPMTKHGYSKAFLRTVSKANELLEAEQIRWRVSWRHNALRHSFVSYRCAEMRDLAAVSDETGHSVAMLKKHYRRVVTPAAAADWFGLLPAAGQVMQLSLFKAG